MVMAALHAQCSMYHMLTHNRSRAIAGWMPRANRVENPVGDAEVHPLRLKDRARSWPNCPVLGRYGTGLSGSNVANYLSDSVETWLNWWRESVNPFSSESRYSEIRSSFHARLLRANYRRNALRSLIRKASARSGRACCEQVRRRRVASSVQYSPRSMTSPGR